MKMKIGLIFVLSLMLFVSMFASIIPKLSNVAAKSSKYGNLVDELSMSGGEFVVDDYTLALWHFNEGEGQVVHDESSHHNDGTLGPTSEAEDSDPSWVSGFTGEPGDYALSFDQFFDYANIPDNPDGSLDLQLFPQFTIEFWAYSRQISRADRGDGQHWNTFLHKAFAPSNPEYVWSGYFVGQASYPQPAPLISFGACYGSEGTVFSSLGVSCIPPPLNEWVLVTVVYDGNYARIYFNNVLQIETNQASSEWGREFVDNIAPFIIGDWPDADWPWFDPIDGVIDEVRFSSVARDSLMLQHDVAISNLTCCKTVVGQGFDTNINVTAENQGTETETFNVTAYYWNGTFTTEQWNVFWGMGDVNRNGFINQADQDAINASFGSVPGDANWNPDTDLNGDGTVDILDTILYAGHSGYNIWKYFGNSTFTSEQWNVFAKMGDVNRDGYINTVDVNTIAANFGWTGTPGTNPADLNRDGKVDMKDIGTCAKNTRYNIWSYLLPAIGTQTIENLNEGDSAALMFTWNTTGLNYGNYTLTTVANPVTNETDTANNNFTSWMIITIPGDIDGDFVVKLADLVLLAQAYGSEPGDSKWNPNADIDGNEIVGLNDLVLLAQNYGRTPG